MKEIFEAFKVVLVEPERAINVGTVIRAMKNMGLSQLILVNPHPMDLDKTQIAAHRSRDVLEKIKVFSSLKEATQNCHYVVGMTARLRRDLDPPKTPREAMPLLIQKAVEEQRIALVFGRESSGLTNEELDLCDQWITIPTDPNYSSLNLAQAVLILSYELFMAAHQNSEPSALENNRELWIEQQLRERLFDQIEHTLAHIGFFKSGNHHTVMRVLRQFFHRSGIQKREFQILMGIFTEVLKFAHLVRRGILPDHLPPVYPKTSKSSE